MAAVHQTQTASMASLSKSETSSKPASRAGTVFALAALVRLVLFELPGLADLLASRVEISTPITSFKRLSEGVFLFRNGVPPYSGGVVHQAPLLLGLFYPIISIPVLVRLLYIASDLAIGSMLSRMAELKASQMSRKQQHEKENTTGSMAEMEGSTWSGLTVASLYLFNPFTVASCVGQSTILFSNVAVVASLWMGMKGNKSIAMFGVALAAYLSLYPIMLAIPVALLLTQHIDGESKKRAIQLSVGFLATWTVALLGLSWVLVGSWDFMSSVYGTILSVRDLTPNLGLLWYFFIEMFDHFRPFFLVVFQLHLFIFAAPVSIKLRHHPLFVAYLLTAIIGTLKAYTSVGDASLYLGLLPLYSEVFKYMRYSFLIGNLFLYSSCLAPIFWYLWVYLGSGNANFYYAVGLVYGIGEIILMVDSTYALLRRDFDLQNPPTKPEDWSREVLQK
ncbi:hypothetical protein DFQ27_007126 [Actinomortierella ambigua]|uniref:Uncharacterized protein n=1 Tax=Actinomortierella ambigua TaxID=1343610 RepID=A0A9P6QGL7_9FUNG|nr:hypothetical protein DFQ27_007126 [Actinomortierella ambigua]